MIVRQLLTESMLLSLTAGALGGGIGWAATRALATWGASQVPQGFPVGLDVRVLLFTLAISLLAGVAFGIFPAAQLARVDLNATLRAEGDLLPPRVPPDAIASRHQPGCALSRASSFPPDFSCAANQLCRRSDSTRRICSP
jgi:hypothetical protein